MQKALVRTGDSEAEQKMSTKAKATIRSLVVGPLATNCHVVMCNETKQAAVVDPGFDASRILGVIEDLGAKVTTILLTHGHVDHVTAAAEVARATSADVAIHPADEPILQAAPAMAMAFGLLSVPVPRVSIRLEDGQTVRVGQVEFEVLHTPGHTPGSVCYHLPGEKVLLSGDTLFFRGVGRTDLPGGSWSELVQSIRDKLYRLDGATEVLTGHGPPTILREEMLQNPFVLL